MIIDFHTHAFAEKIAQRAIESLEATAGVPACTRGTIEELLAVADSCGVTKSVLLPVATKPTQHTVVNNWAKLIQDTYPDKIFAFGSVHPDAIGVLEEIERIKEMGLYGVKLHPDYMGFLADDEKYFYIFEKIAALGLPVILHAGYDPLSPDLIHCTPKMARKLFDSVPDLTLILAHAGGERCWDEVEKYLCGLQGNLYFDIAYTAGIIGDEQLTRIIKSHGADRILFASDCPWHSPDKELEILNSLPLTTEEKEQILYKNALRLLKAE